MTGPAPGGRAAKPGTSDFTHLDARGHARMVDVTTKSETTRRAVARCVVRAGSEAIERALKAEDALELARAAGILAAKKTSDLVPLCHPLPLDGVELRLRVESRAIEVEAETQVIARTGVEMEALSACAGASLALVMQLLCFDPDSTIDTLSLWHKSGGRSGTWERDRS